MHNYIIDWIEVQLLPYKLIYSLRLVGVKILKVYFKTNLANDFRKSFKFFANASILIVIKSNSSLSLYINYQAFNNCILQNQYCLPLINGSLD